MQYWMQKDVMVLQFHSILHVFWKFSKSLPFMIMLRKGDLEKIEKHIFHLHIVFSQFTWQLKSDFEFWLKVTLRIN